MLAESGAVDFASSVAPPIPNDRVLAGFTPAVVPSDFADDKPTEALEEKLNPVNAGDDDDEIAGLLLDTANKVEAAEPTEGLSVGGTVASFGDEECGKPLLRLAEVDAAEAKWTGTFCVVDAADGKTLSDDLMTSSAFSVLSPSSELLSDVVSLVTLKHKRQNRLADLKRLKRTGLHSYEDHFKTKFVFYASASKNKKLDKNQNYT